ncbi:MAG TPA: winged helix-turn-helix transcriptional regulator, partial [Candidatus Thermoplasmatota archaeon]|nr:winged helix-turn-helix transcriptional regulator [Candidatus Thermoplasmatota archaeon]
MASRLLRPHPRRTLILAALHERPGLCLRELARVVGIPNGTLRFHLSHLIRCGAVWTTQRGVRLLHFPATVPRVPVAAI